MACLHGQAVQEGHDSHLQHGELGVFLRAAAGAGGGLLGGPAAAGGQSQDHRHGEQESEQFLLHDSTSLYPVWLLDSFHNPLKRISLELDEILSDLRGRVNLIHPLHLSLF